jgi:hypothetical protein
MRRRIQKAEEIVRSSASLYRELAQSALSLVHGQR